MWSSTFEAGRRLVRPVVITGPNGVGKTTTALELHHLLAERGHSSAFIDVDHLTKVLPVPDDDPHNSRFGIQNLATMWPNYLSRGIEYVVVARIIADVKDRQRYRWAFGDVEPTIVRITASRDSRHARIHQRARNEVEVSRQWELDRSDELAAELAVLGVEDFTVDSEGKAPRQVAEEILDSLR